MPAAPKCRKCGSPDVPTYRVHKGDYLCRPCFNAWVRVYRAQRPEKRASPEQRRAYDAATFQRQYADPIRRQKHKARVLARKAVARGEIARKPCEICGAEKVEAHHDDYTKALNVRWLCPAHHRAHHAALRAASLGVGKAA